MSIFPIKTYQKFMKNMLPQVPKSFITRFDAELEMFLRDIFEKSFSRTHELEFFSNNA